MEIIESKNVAIDEIVMALKKGQTLVYPTETCYGLGCDATHTEAVEKIFAIKGRDKRKPCILLFPDIESLKKYANIDPVIEEKIVPYWPGALTVVLALKENTDLSPLLISSERKIACRISSSPFIQNLLKEFDHPLVSTSANMSGGANIYTSKEIEIIFTDIVRPDIFIDGGNLRVTPPSTLVEVEGEVLNILRQGDVKIDG